MGDRGLFWQSDVPLCRVVFPADLTDTVQDTEKHPPNQYSSFHEHFNRSFRTRAGWLHATAVIPSCRHEVWPSPEAALHLCLSSLWRTDWSVARKADNLTSSFPNHAPQGFITPSTWPRAQTPDNSAPLLLCVLALFCLGRRLGRARSSLARSLGTLRKKAAKWHPGGNQKHALASPSLVFKVIGDHIQLLALHRLQANTQACMKARRGIKEWVLCFGEVLVTEAQKGAHRTFDPLLLQCGGPAQVNWCN